MFARMHSNVIKLIYVNYGNKNRIWTQMKTKVQLTLQDPITELKTNYTIKGAY